MSFEQVKTNSTAQNKRLILATPALLREVANRLEKMSDHVSGGESVLCELTAGITVVFQPSAVYGAKEGVSNESL